MAAFTAAPAAADPPQSTRQRATSIMESTYGGFAFIKQSHESPFDWSSDGCSWTPPPQRWEQEVPCQEHDFGYRNFGKGLTLDRTEARRAWIDQRFLSEMLRNCNQHPFSPNCYPNAMALYAAVRNMSDWRD